MPTTRSPNSQLTASPGRAGPTPIQDLSKLLPILPAASSEAGERQYLLILFFVSYIAVLGTGLTAIL